MKVFGLEKKAIMDAITSGRAIVTVYGLGKMGLPLAAFLAGRGARVIGVDIGQKLVDGINKGRCPVANEPTFPEMLKANRLFGFDNTGEKRQGDFDRFRGL